MEVILLVLLLAASACDSFVIREEIFVQYVDHSSNETEEFNMRYFTNYDMWKVGGPVYVYIGDEKIADPTTLQAGLVVQLAQETNGAILLLEHRYYGLSDIPIALEERRFGNLTIKNVLEDIAHFIRNIKETSGFEKAKVVAVGASYAGRLATWMRLKYPDLVDAAIASSAPLKNVLEYPEYLDNVAKIYEEVGGYKCLNAIREKITFERFLLENNGEDYFRKEENFCPEVRIESETQKGMYGFHVLSQVNEPVAAFNFESVVSQCTKIVNNFYSADKTDDCFYFNFTLKGWNVDPYDFLRCSELGQFLTSYKDSKLPFQISSELYLERCAFVYGEDYYKGKLENALKQLDEDYGGDRPDVTRVVFVNGGMDPWRHLGVLEDLSHEAPAVVIPHGIHTQDLLPDLPDDTFSLRDARRRIKDLVKSWIGVQKHASNITWTFFKPY